MRFLPFTPSELCVVPSRLYLGLSGSIALGSSLCLAALALPLWLKAAGIFGVVLNVGWRMRQQGWWPRRSILFTLSFDDQGWSLHEQGRTLRLQRVDAVKLTGWILFLKARTLEGKTRHFSLWRDSLSPSNFRALYVALKFNAFADEQETAAAGLLQKLRQKFSGTKIVSLISGARSG